MVRIDTLPEPMPDDIDDVGLRAAHFARGGEAVAMIEADGSHLINPSLTLKWGEAATWPPADPSEAPLIGTSTRLQRVTCWLSSDVMRREPPS